MLSSHPFVSRSKQGVFRGALIEFVILNKVKDPPDEGDPSLTLRMTDPIVSNLSSPDNRFLLIVKVMVYVEFY